MEEIAAKMRLVRPQEVVAFLQNPWFKSGTKEKHIKQYQSDVKFRRMVLQMSMTGRRLYQAFGNLWYDEIWWDNANPRPTSDALGALPPDIAHIFDTINNRAPSIVLTFGLHARNGVTEVIHQMKGRVEGIAWIEQHVMHCHHPNARFKNQGDLDHFALAVKRKVVPV